MDVFCSFCDFGYLNNLFSVRLLGCHGETVLPYIQQYPNLKGQKPAYITKQLKAFKSGERENVYMQVTAKQLSEQDMVDVAEYYSTLQPDDLKTKAEKALSR